MYRTTRFINLFFLLLVWLTGGCASDRPPSGGPADNAPLQVVFSDPAPSATNVATRTIHLTFSQIITGRQLLQNLFFSPAVGDYDIAVSGKNAEIRLYSPLKANQTYTLSISKFLTDSRGRTIAHPWNIGFSTGPMIQTGMVKGTVLNTDFSPATNAMVMAFGVHPQFSESHNLLTREPDYLAQTDTGGTFSFTNLAAGSYRIVAINDRNHDMHYNARSEEIGLSSLATIPAGSTGLLFRFGEAGSKSTGIISCKPVDRQQLEISFHKPLRTTSFESNDVEIRHALTGIRIPVTSWYSKNRLMFDSEFCIIASALEPAQPYTIRYRTDKTSDKTDGVPFYASTSKPGAERFSLSISPENGSDPAFLDLEWPSLGKSVLLKFSLPVRESGVKGALTLSEERSEATLSLPFSLIKIDDRTFALQTTKGFEPRHSYVVNFLHAATSPLILKPVVSKFRVASKESTGSLSGKCLAAGPYLIVEAKRAGSSSAYRTIASKERNGTFRYSFAELPPGNYTLSAFQPSANKKADPWQQWNPGSVEPFQPAEPFGLYPGTVAVRARWSTENIDIPVTLPVTNKL